MEVQNDGGEVPNDDEYPFHPHAQDHQSILEEAEKIVNSSRAKEYGDAEENFTRAANILESMLSTEDWNILGSKSHITADLMIKAMMAVKLARHAHKRKRDNLVDLCGYAELLSRVQRL